MMNPQYSGSAGPNMPPGGYGPPGPSQMSGGPRPPPPGAGMYNGTMGQHQPPPPGQFGGPSKPPGGMGPPPQHYGPPGAIQNGPHSGGYPGPQGDIQMGGPRGPMSSPSKPPGQFGPPPMGTSSAMMGPGPGQGPQHRGPIAPGGHMAPPGSTAQVTNQMGGMNLSGPRGYGPMSHNPPSSVGMTPGGGMGPPGSGGPQGPRMGAPTSSMGGMGPPPQGGMGPPVSGSSLPPGMGPPHQTSMGPQPPGPPHSSAMGPPHSSAMGPPHSSAMGPPQPPSMGPPQSAGFGQQHSAGMSQPPQMPQSQFSMPGGGPPLSNVGPPPTSYSNHPDPGISMGSGTPPLMGGSIPPTSQFGSMPPTSQYGQMPSTGQFGSSGPPTSQYGGQYAGAPPAMGGPPPPGGQYPPPAGPGGQFPGYSGPPGQQRGMPAQQPPQKKLDPDQMPSPIQVIEDDRRNRSGLFQTATRGQVPPLVTTQFITQDQGNCNPRFMRSTMYNVPCTADMLKSAHIPFAVTISPFATLQSEENPPPLVNLGDLGPVRCKRCKAYMSPVMLFIDGGRRFQCVFCGAATEVPSEYFNHLDHTGRRVDQYDRAELCLGSYDMVATKEYCKDGILPQAPAFIFMIDVSYNSVKSGLVHLICERLKEDILVNLPKEAGAKESEIRVGFVTYAKDIHFYNVKGSLAQPQMMVVSDLEDMFVPLLEGFLVKLSESEAVIDSLLAQIPQMFAESRETETVLGPVIQAGLDALKSSGRAGKLYIFHTSLPIAEAPGKLKNRDDRKLLATDKEKTILTPQGNFYTKLGQECVSAGCSVDLFLFPNAYVDVASMAEVCRLTSGNMYKYSYFQADLDGERFLEDLRRNVQNMRAFDAILRVRTSTGIRAVDFLGNFYMSNTTDVEIAAMDCDQALSVEIKHDDKLNEGDGAYIQVAVLYTSVIGQRQLRIHNLSLNCCTQMAELFRNCELDILVNYMARVAIRNTLNNNPRQVRETVMNIVANILACYRKNCASPSSAGQLILPECMKLLPLYGNCVIKNDGIQGGSEISTDDRSYLMYLINGMDVKTSSVFFYPRLIPLHDLDPEGEDVPSAIRCSADRLQEDGVYLLENGVSMFMWIGHNVDPEWIQKIFSVQSQAQVDIDKCQLLDLDNPISQRVRNVLRQIREDGNRFMKLTIVRQRDKLEPWFNHFLVEDKGFSGSASYVDFLCHIHKEIRNLLS